MSALDTIRSGYAFTSAAIDLGVALDDGTPVPDVPVRIPVAMFNRHGLVAGATGTGKTVTLQVMAEQLSRAGVPVFAADMKGDLTGMATAATPSEKLTARTAAIGQQWQPTACPVEFYTLGGHGTGVPIRATVSAFGPLLLAKVLELNDTQESVLSLIFHYADQAGLALLDLADLKAVLAYLDSAAGKAELKGIGGVSGASVGVILRKISALEAQGADAFFGEPEFDTSELLRCKDGHGVVSLLELPDVAQQPALFSTFLMWLLADLFQDLPEVGDIDVPKLVFFFDEAHLLFRDASKAFLSHITQTVRLIRSKGVGVFFVTQTPKDVPADVLAQLGSRVQHQLRAHTPDDAKALKATVQTFPTSPFDLAQLLTSLGTGEAVITVMDPDGAPTPVAPTRMRAPESRIGPSEQAVVEQIVQDSGLLASYGTPIDRESAREILTQRLEAGAAEANAGSAPQPGPAAPPRDANPPETGSGHIPLPDGFDAPAKAPGRKKTTRDPSVFEQVVQSSAFKQFTRTAAREIARGIFGTGRRRR